MTDQEIMERAFRKQFPAEAVVLEAIRLARQDEQERLQPGIVRADERKKVVALIDDLRQKLEKSE